MGNLASQMSLFVGVAAFIFLLLGVIWKAETFLDFIFKVSYLLMAISGGFLWLQANGYLVHVIH